MFAVNLRFFFTIDVHRDVINWKRDANTSRKKRRGGSARFGKWRVDFTRYAKTKQTNYFVKNIAGINKNTTVIEKRHWRYEKYLLDFLLDFPSSVLIWRGTKVDLSRLPRSLSHFTA